MSHGCFNREIDNGYYVEERVYHPSGIYHLEMRFIEHTMTKDCQWSIEHDSPLCDGCKHDKRKPSITTAGASTSEYPAN